MNDGVQSNRYVLPSRPALTIPILSCFPSASLLLHDPSCFCPLLSLSQRQVRPGVCKANPRLPHRAGTGGRFVFGLPFPPSLSLTFTSTALPRTGLRDWCPLFTLSSTDDGYYDHMDPRAHRTPSPGNPLQHGYQLDDNPHGNFPPSQGLDVQSPGMNQGRFSPGDALQMQMAVSPIYGRI